jgi:hypothetical protein
MSSFATSTRLQTMVLNEVSAGIAPRSGIAPTSTVCSKTLFPWRKEPGREAGNSVPASAKVKNAGICFFVIYVTATAVFQNQSTRDGIIISRNDVSVVVVAQYNDR